MTSTARVLVAAQHPDWLQVVYNLGPPCFHVMPDGCFCLRAQRWQGHGPDGTRHDHLYVSLADMLAQHLLAGELETELRAYLWRHHGHGHAGLYDTDGERQCAACQVYDYNRAPLAEIIRQALFSLRLVVCASAGYELSPTPYAPASNSTTPPQVVAPGEIAETL